MVDVLSDFNSHRTNLEDQELQPTSNMQRRSDLSQLDSEISVYVLSKKLCEQIVESNMTLWY